MGLETEACCIMGLQEPVARCMMGSDDGARLAGHDAVTSRSLLIAGERRVPAAEFRLRVDIRLRVAGCQTV